MISRLHLSAILLCAAILWGLLLIAQGVTVEATWLKPFSTVIGGVLLLLLAFDKWLWRWGVLQGWFVKKPDLQGTWQIELSSQWKDPQTGESPPNSTTFLVVRQSFSLISLRMLTPESSSEVLGANIIEAPDGTYRVYAVYRNEPKISVRERSPIHYGGLVLAVEGSPVNCLSGHYWTDRNSCGLLSSISHKPKICASFDEARSLFN